MEFLSKDVEKLLKAEAKIKELDFIHGEMENLPRECNVESKEIIDLKDKMNESKEKCN